MEQPPRILISDNMHGYPAGQLVAVSFRDGLIEAVLQPDLENIEVLASEAGSGVLDYRGSLVLPGLIDAHLHAIATGMQLLSVDLHDVSNLAELADSIQEVAARGQDFVRLAGLDPSRLREADHARLNRAWLDQQVTDRPLAIKSVEGHSSWFNTPGWERVGIDTVMDKLSVPQAEQARMYLAGRAEGNTYEHITTPIYDSYSFAERREGMGLVISQAQAAGCVGLHCLEGYGEYREHDFKLIQELNQRDDIDLTLYARDYTPELAHKLGITRFGGCWCVDGAIGAFSAAISEPYADRPDSTGELYFSDGELREWLEAGLELDMQVCIHAIGDRAQDQAIRVFESLAGAYDLHRLRPRVDHFVLGTSEQAQRMGELGITCAMQPAFDARWGGTEGGYATRLGAERAMQSNPVGLAVRNGLRIAGSSDSYITPIDPLGGIRAAMNHHNPAMRVDFDTAVELFSSSAAYLAHQDDKRGSIAEGYQADFTIVAGDRTLTDASVAATIKGGQVVYCTD